MTDYEKLEERRQMARRNYYAQMAMMGFDSGGNALDLVEVVRCRDCKHAPTDNSGKRCIGGSGITFPDDLCPCKCEDSFYSWMPENDWYCANGERREPDA